MEPLNILFGGENRVRIMRLFLFNPGESYDLETISDKSRVKVRLVKDEVFDLKKAGLIKGKSFYKDIVVKKRGKITEHKKKVQGFVLNEGFPYMTAIKQLLISTKTLEGGEIVKRLSKSGKLKLVIISGVFIQNQDSRVDILVVGDKVNKSTLDRSIRAIESELGKELTYAYFDLADYHYRLGMYDKLIRDVLDFPHQVLIDKINQ